MMGKDSKKALELVRISKQIQKPLVEHHNGKWLKEMGDGAIGLIVCFAEDQYSIKWNWIRGKSFNLTGTFNSYSKTLS